MRALQGSSPDPLRGVGIGVDHQEGPVGVALFRAVAAVEHVEVPVTTAAAVDEEPEGFPAAVAQPRTHHIREVDLLPSGLLVVEGERHRRGGFVAKFLQGGSFVKGGVEEGVVASDGSK